MKRILAMLAAFVFLLAACTAAPNSSVVSNTSSGGASQSSSASSSDVAPTKYNEDAEKYFDYFNEHGYVSMLLGDEYTEGSFSDGAMAAYALCELMVQSGSNYDQAVGFAKEDIDAVTEKYFGATIQNYETKKSTVIAETGNITSTGWGASQPALVLKELKTEADGSKTAVFYQVAADSDSAKEDLLSGKFDDYGQVYLVTIQFEEKTDENGKMYLRYLQVKPQGEATAPYEVYNG